MSLRFKIFLGLIFFSILPLFIFGHLESRKNIRVRESEFSKMEISYGKTVLRSLQIHLAKEMSLIENEAGLHIGPVLNNSALDSVVEATRKMALPDDIESFSIVDLDGRLLYSSEATSPIASNAWHDWLEPARQGRPAIGKHHRDSASGKILLPLAVPIFESSDSNRQIGVLIASYRWELIDKILGGFRVEGLAQTESRHFMLTDRDGLVIWCFDSHEMLTENLITIGMKSAIEAHAGREGFVHERSEHGLESFSIYTHSEPEEGYPDPGWLLVVLHDPKDVFLEVNERNRNFYLLIGAMALALFLFSWILSKDITRPIDLIIQAIKRTTLESMDQKITISAKGEMGLLIKVFNEMAERLSKSRVELSERQEENRLVLQTASDAFVGINANGVIIDWNKKAETVFGWSREEILGKDIAQTIVSPKYRQAHLDGMKMYLAGGAGPVQHRAVEISALRRDGSEFPVEITMWPVRMKKEIRLNAFIRDLTEKKALERQLLQSQKMESVGTLAGGIAHDLNNQLTPVRGYIDLLLQQTSPENENYVLLSEAGLAAQRCAEVIQRLNQFARRTTQKKTVFFLSQVLAESKAIIKNFLPATIQVQFACAEDLWPVEANETEIQTVLVNLCVNARDAMPQGGRLTVEAKNADPKTPITPADKTGPHVLVTVTDTGSGMPPEVIKYIFEPFYTTKEKGKGTGLGLAMAYKIIDDHKGWIEVNSQVGLGTVFQIYLPALPKATISSREKPAGISKDLLAKNETILLADDEESIRNFCRTALIRLGYQVLTAQDGEEVLSLYRKKCSGVDALLLDMTMPKMTGLQLIQKILEINPKAKIILASGFTAEATTEELLEKGAKDFIQKPYTIQILGEALRKIFNTE